MIGNLFPNYFVEINFISMKTKFKNIETNTFGELPCINDIAPNFTLVNADLFHISLEDFQGTRLILNIFPSLDTSVCAMAVRKFNGIASNLKDTIVLCISKDLPFAQKRFCSVEGISNVIALSEFRPESRFGTDYGVVITDGALRGLFARAIIVISDDGKILYSQLNKEIAEEPDYNAVLKAIS